MALWPRRVLMMPIRMYRRVLSPWLGTQCRFWPTCSAYGLEALDVHGARKGTVLTVWRIVRCNPWCQGGHDPVPPKGHRLFSFPPSVNGS